MRQRLLFLALALALSACGVKNDLVKPNGQTTTTKEDHDPSKPPYPLGH